MAKPNFFIIGGPKCATTSLHNTLNQHPAISMSSIKEPCYFLPKEALKKDPRGALKKKDYYNLFKKTKKTKVIGESSTAYSFYPESIKNIKKEIENPKFILILKNPGNLIASLHNFLFRGGIEKKTDLKKALEEGQRRIKEYKKDKKLEKKYQCYYLLISEIFKTTKIISKENSKIILFEDLIKNKEQTILSILKFLEVKATKLALRKDNISNIGIKSLFYHRILTQFQKLPTPISKTIKKIFPNKLKNIIININIKPEKIKKIDPKLKKSINNHFKKDIQEISKILKKDLIHWLDD